jgi:hypothetical protein
MNNNLINLLLKKHYLKFTLNKTITNLYIFQKRKGLNLIRKNIVKYIQQKSITH